MKCKIMVILCVILIALTGCFKNEEIPQRRPVGEINTDGTEIKANLTLDEIVNPIKAQGLELIPNKKEPWVLNEVKATIFAVSYPTAKMESPTEYVDIYIFKDMKAREEGLADFNKQKEKDDLKEKINMLAPIVWQNSNALVLYWHHSAKGEKTAFEEEIGMALTGWEKIKY